MLTIRSQLGGVDAGSLHRCIRSLRRLSNRATATSRACCSGERRPGGARRPGPSRLNQRARGCPHIPHDMTGTLVRTPAGHAGPGVIGRRGGPGLRNAGHVGLGGGEAYPAFLAMICRWSAPRGSAACLRAAKALSAWRCARPEPTSERRPRSMGDGTRACCSSLEGIRGYRNSSRRRIKELQLENGGRAEQNSSRLRAQRQDLTSGRAG